MKTFAKFAAVGVVNTLVCYCVYCALVYGGAGINFSAVAGWFIAMLNSYFLNKLWVFESGGRVRAAQVIAFVAVNISALGANLLLLNLLARGFNINPYLAQIFSLSVSTLMNYLGMRFWVFTAGKK